MKFQFQVLELSFPKFTSFHCEQFSINSTIFLFLEEVSFILVLSYQLKYYFNLLFCYSLLKSLHFSFILSFLIIQLFDLFQSIYFSMFFPNYLLFLKQFTTRVKARWFCSHLFIYIICKLFRAMQFSQLNQPEVFHNFHFSSALTKFVVSKHSILVIGDILTLFFDLPNP